MCDGFNPDVNATFIIGYSLIIASNSLKRVKVDGNLSSGNSWMWTRFRVNP